MTKITADWLRVQRACDAGVDSFLARLGEDGSVDALEHLRYLAATKPEWGVWVGVHLPEFASVRARWMLYLLTDQTSGVRRYTGDRTPARAVVDRVAGLWERETRGDSPTLAEWTAAARAESAGAARAEWAAARVAAGAAESAGAAGAAESARGAWAAEAAAEWAERAARAAARAAGSGTLVALLAEMIRLLERL